MKKILTILFTVLSGAVMAQKPVQTIGNKNNIVKVNGELVSDSAIVFPKDTIQLQSTDRGLAIKNDEVYIWRGSRWDSLSKVTNASSAINNGLISTGGISLVDSTVTISSPIIWSYNGVTYTRSTDTSFIIHSADSGYFRRDLIYADTSGLLYKSVGTEDTARALVPTLPANSITVTIVDVYGNHITSPTPVIIGAIPNLRQVLNEGDSAENMIYLHYNSGDYSFITNSDRNGYAGIKIINTDSSSNAAAGIIAYNNVDHFAQWYQGSPANIFAPDQFLVRGSGYGGIKIVADTGAITFQRGLIETPYTPFILGGWDKNNNFYLNKVDSGNANSANLAYFDNNILKRGNLSIYTQHQIDSIAALKLNISDTASMLSPYQKKTDSVNVALLNGGKIDTSHLPTNNLYYQYPAYAVNDSTAGIRTDSMPLLTYGAGADTSLISGRKIPTADWVLARVGSGTVTVTTAVDTLYRTPGKDSIQYTINGRYHAILDSTGGGGSSSTIDVQDTATTNGQTNFVFASLPSRYIVFVNNMPFTNFTTSGGTTIIVGFTDIVAGDIIRLYQTQ